MENKTFEILYYALLTILLAVTILITIVLLLNYLKIVDIKRTEEWNKTIDNVLVDVITQNDIQLVLNIIPYKLHNNNKFKTLFTSRIVEASQKFSGNARDRLRNLYTSLGLHNFSLSKIRSQNQNTIAEGIKELSIMEQKGHLAQIHKFINHRSKYVYVEAQSALVRNYGFKGIVFLDNLTNRLSEWQCLRLIVAIDKLETEDISKISFWLKSTNPSVVVIALMLVKKFRLVELHDEVAHLLSNQSSEIVRNTISVLTFIESEKTALILTDIFHTKCHELQLEIMRALGKIQDSKTFTFIKKELISNESTDIRIQSAVNLQKSQWKEWSDDIVDPVAVAILNHAKNELI